MSGMLNEDGESFRFFAPDGTESCVCRCYVGRDFRIRLLWVPVRTTFVSLILLGHCRQEHKTTKYNQMLYINLLSATVSLITLLVTGAVSGCFTVAMESKQGIQWLPGHGNLLFCSLSSKG